MTAILINKETEEEIEVYDEEIVDFLNSKKYNLIKIESFSWSDDWDFVIKNINNENTKEKFEMEMVKRDSALIQWIPNKDITKEMARESVRQCRSMTKYIPINILSKEMIIDYFKEWGEKHKGNDSQMTIGKIKCFKKEILIEILMILKKKENDDFYKEILKNKNIEELVEDITKEWC